VLAVDVFGLRGEIPRGIQRDEPGVLHRAHGLQQTRFIKSLVQIIKEAEQLARLDRVEHLTDVVITGDALDAKEGTGVVAAVRLLHVLLETQEGGTLGKEDRKGRQRDVLHEQADILAGAAIGQAGQDGPPAFDDPIEAVRVHEPRNARKRAGDPVTIG